MSHKFVDIKLEVEVIKRLLLPLNKPAPAFKNGKKSAKNSKKCPSTYVFNSSYNFRAREKFNK